MNKTDTVLTFLELVVHHGRCPMLSYWVQMCLHICALFGWIPHSGFACVSVRIMCNEIIDLEVVWLMLILGDCHLCCSWTKLMLELRLPNFVTVFVLLGSYCIYSQLKHLNFFSWTAFRTGYKHFVTLWLISYAW